MSSDLSNGAIFAGRYRIERRIAAGGMGAVYEVVHLETNRRRALKVMHENFVHSDELRGRFRQEARVAAEIESEYIVDVFDAGIDETTGMPFLVMELLRGEELGKRLRRTGTFPAADVVSYLHQTSLALDKTHRANIVHRDLKPDNIFLCEREDGPPRVKVLDFGIAKMVAEGATQAAATRSLGTPLYMAPEQFLMDVKVSAATDIFALGMIAFTFLVGKPYWTEESRSGASVFAFAANAALGPKETASVRATKLGGSVPPAFDVWFARATAKNAADRFPTAVGAVKALAEALGVPHPGFAGAGEGAPVSVPRPALGSLPVAPAMAPLSGQVLPSMTPVRAPFPSVSTSPGLGMGASSPFGPAGQAATPMAGMMTPLASGMTAATATPKRSPAILIGFGGTLVLGILGFVLYAVILRPSEKPAQGASAAVTSAAPVVAPAEPTVAPAAAPSAAATATTSADVEPPKVETAKPFSTQKTPRGTLPTVVGTTKKPAWQND